MLQINLRAWFVCFVFLLFVFLRADFVFSQDQKIELILKGKIASVEAFQTDEVIDALDSFSAEGALPSATVVFRVVSVVKGTLPTPKPSEAYGLFAQTKEAYKEKNFLKMITMDYENPEVEREDKPRWFAIGVQSPSETFQVLSWTDVPTSIYRLEFSKSRPDGGWVLQSARTDS